MQCENGITWQRNKLAAASAAFILYEANRQITEHDNSSWELAR